MARRIKNRYVNEELDIVSGDKVYKGKNKAILATTGNGYLLVFVNNKTGKQTIKRMDNYILARKEAIDFARGE